MKTGILKEKNNQKNQKLFKKLIFLIE